MLSGDVRYAMTVLNTLGTKEVIARLPDEEVQVRQDVFQPIHSVARVPGNSSVLDDLKDNILIGSSATRNLDFALLAIVELKPVAIDADDIKVYAAEIYKRSFYYRVLEAQRKAVPRMLLYLFLAASCFVFPVILKYLVWIAIKKYASTQDTDVALALTAVTNQNEYDVSFGAMSEMMKDVVSNKHSQKDLIPLMPSSPDMGIQHMLTLVSRLDSEKLEYYDASELREFQAYLDMQKESNQNVQKSIDASTRNVMIMIKCNNCFMQPVCDVVTWCGGMLIMATLIYYTLVIVKCIIQTIMDVYKLNYWKQIWNGALLVTSICAVANACAAETYSYVSISFAVGLCVASLMAHR